MRDTQAQADSITTVTGNTFASLVLDSPGPIAVEFMSYGCSHCRALEPVLQEVANAVKDTEHVYRVNVALDESLADRYGINGTPTLIMFENALEVGRSEGPRPNVAAIRSAITQPFR